MSKFLEVHDCLTQPGECSGGSHCSEFLWAYYNDRTVYQMARQNESLEKIIGVLAKEKQEIQQRLLELEMAKSTRIIIPNVEDHGSLPGASVADRKDAE